MKVDANRRAGLRKLRTVLELPQNKLAAKAGVSPSTVLRFERCRRVSEDSDRRIVMALFDEYARRNPEQLKRAAEPLHQALQKMPAAHPLRGFLLAALENFSL